MTNKALSQILSKAKESRGVQQLSQEDTSKVSGGLTPAGMVDFELGGELVNIGDVSIIKDHLIGSEFESSQWSGNAYRYSF